MSTSTITVGGQSVTLVSFPTAPGPKAVEWNLADSVGLVRSVFTGQAQAQKWPGADLLSGTLTLAPRTQLQADDWIAFLMQLRGRANAFQLGDPLQPLPRGSGSGLPLVDNTVSGNLAGSETVDTKGWTANAVGVLKRGDWIQLGYRLHRVLDDVNADGSGKATFPIWPTLREQPSNDGTSAGFVNATGTTSMVRSGPLIDYDNGIRWYNFSTPVLPSDAIVTGIYPVLICAASYDGQIFNSISYGNNGTSGFPGTIDVGGSIAGNFDHPGSGPPNTSFGSTEWYALNCAGQATGTGIGANLAHLANQAIEILLYCSLSQGSTSDSIAATGVGFAVYYTSATPTTDPQMPPPFTVPSGSGVAWSLPQSVIQTGTTRTGGTTATAAQYNGGITLNSAKGLFRLAKNQRGWSADISRLSRISFPFEEYR